MSTPKYSFYYRIYNLLLGNPITKQDATRVKKQYEILCPASEKSTVKMTVKTLGISFVLLMVAFVLIFCLRPGMLQFIIAVFVAIILHKEIIQFHLNRLEERILGQFERFITDVRHHYYVSHMIDEAILDALDETPYEMRVHAQKIYDIITSDHCEELADQYHLTSHNNYLNLFLALCVTVVEYGDRMINDQSLFLLNLSNLKTEVNIGILKIKQVNYLYSGLTFVILTPMTLLKVIEHWGISNLPELATFYQSRAGLLTAFTTIICTLIIYVVVSDLKENQMHLPVQHFFIDSILSFRCVQAMIKNYIKDAHPNIVKLQQLIEESCEMITIQQLLIMKFMYALMSLMGCLATSVIYLVKDHDRFDWYELVISLTVAYVCFHIPDYRLMFHRKIARMGREDEIICYQSIVLMLMYIERVSVLEILERIEEFSRIFRKQIQNCINNFNSSDKRTLEEFKESTDFVPLQRFIDNLIISDEIGIEKAFDEVASDRVYFQEKRKQENSISLERRSELAKFLAYIPSALVIGGYLILPFLVECYNQLKIYREMMKSL